MARASKFPLRISTARAQTRRPERSTFRGAATLLVAILMLIALSVREFQGLLIERLEGRLDRSTTPPACGPPRDEADDIGLIASYYVPPTAAVAGASADAWSVVANATLKNHEIAAKKFEIRYARVSSAAHPRCGKMRAVRDLLEAEVLSGDWLVFVDADAAFRCASKLASSLGRIARRRYGLVVGNRFGFFAIRREPWAFDWLERMASAQESRPLLCAVHQWPENAVSRVVNADGDKCHVVVEPDFARDNIRHAAGSGEKRGAALRSRLEEFAEETSCF